MPDRPTRSATRPGLSRPDRITTGFVPSVHGFAFPNTWRDTFLGVVASRGRCGGMVFAALDHFYAGETPPRGDDGGLPAHDSALAHYIWRRQVASVANGFGINLWQFVLLTYLPTFSRFGAAATTRRDLGPLVDSLAAGRPVPLGLVSGLRTPGLFRNHQVLAVAAEAEEDRVRIHVYDPNYPRRDDVVIEVPRAADAPVIERIGARTTPWRGLFVERYLPVRVERDVAGPLIERAASTRVYWLAAGSLLALWWLFRLVFRRR